MTQTITAIEAAPTVSKPPSSSLGAARRKLQAALDAIDHTDVTFLQARKAHVMAAGAAMVLEQHLATRTAADLGQQQAHVRALARTMRDSRGRRRTAVTMPGYGRGRTPASKGITYQYTPPTINETLRMLAVAPTLRLVERGECPSCHALWRTRHRQECVNPYGERLKALIFILWRCGLRIGCEALRLTETDLYPDGGYLHVAHGKNDKAREVAVDDWLWPLLEPWLTFRQEYPPGPLFCVLEGPNAGRRAWGGPSVRLNVRDLAKLAGIRHRVHPHGWRHALTLEQRDEGIDTLIISRNLGHANLGTTDIYLRGFPQSRVISELRGRPAPKVSMFDMLRSAGVPVGDRPEISTGGSGPTPDLMGVLARA